MVAVERILTEILVSSVRGSFLLLRRDRLATRQQNGLLGKLLRQVYTAALESRSPGGAVESSREATESLREQQAADSSQESGGKGREGKGRDGRERNIYYLYHHFFTVKETHTTDVGLWVCRCASNHCVCTEYSQHILGSRHVNQINHFIVQVNNEMIDNVKLIFPMTSAPLAL